MISKLVQLAIKIPCIHYEYRGFSNFYGCFRNGAFAILGHFWVNSSPNAFEIAAEHGMEMLTNASTNA